MSWTNTWCQITRWLIFFPTKLLYIFTKITELCSFRSVRDTDLKQPGGVSLLSQSFRDYYVSGACVKHSLSGTWPPDTCFRPWSFRLQKKMCQDSSQLGSRKLLKPVSRIFLRSREAETMVLSRAMGWSLLPLQKIVLLNLCISAEALFLIFKP